MVGLLASCTLVGPADEAPKHLFVLSGQSNMARLDPGRSFTPAVEEALGEERVIVVKDAASGQPMRRWHQQWKPAEGPAPAGRGDLYERLLRKVKRAIAGETLASVTLVWMQGERDAREGHGAVYAASLRGLLGQLRRDLGRQRVNLVVGRLSDFDLADERYRDWTTIRAAQVSVAESIDEAVWVDTDDLNDGDDGSGRIVADDLHYSKAGYDTLGRRFAEAALGLIKEGGK